VLAILLSGKTLAVEAIANELGALLINMSAAKVRGLPAFFQGKQVRYTHTHHRCIHVLIRSASNWMRHTLDLDLAKCICERLVRL
jgi:hypothetical protein